MEAIGYDLVITSCTIDIILTSMINIVVISNHHYDKLATIDIFSPKFSFFILI